MFANNTGIVSMASVLIDTDILIDVANKDANAVSRLKRESQTAQLAVSSITAMELVIGCRNKPEQQALERFLAKFQVLPLSSEISERAIALLTAYYLSHGLLVADALIAATAITHNMSLLSKNQRDFRFIQELTLLPYP
jgi:predicted nucleic acid-binding protein